jgi:thioredoxin 1
MSNVTQFTAADFDTVVLQADKPVLVDFWATWCGPCRAVAPVIEQIAEEYADQIDVGKVDVDAEGAIAARYNVASIPTIILFKDGEPVAQSLGAVPKEELIRRFKDHF